MLLGSSTLPRGTKVDGPSAGKHGRVSPCSCKRTRLGRISKGRMDEIPSCIQKRRRRVDPTRHRPTPEERTLPNLSGTSASRRPPPRRISRAVDLEIRLSNDAVWRTILDPRTNRCRCGRRTFVLVFRSDPRTSSLGPIARDDGSEPRANETPSGGRDRSIVEQSSRRNSACSFVVSHSSLADETRRRTCSSSDTRPFGNVSEPGSTPERKGL